MSMGRPPSPDRLMSQQSVLSVKAETFAQRLSSYIPLISASAQHLSFAAPKPQTGDPAAFVHDLWLAKLVQLGMCNTDVVYSCGVFDTAVAYS